MKILVTGGRAYSDKETVYKVLDRVIIDIDEPICIIHGGANGADSLAEEFCEERGIPSIVMFARWKRLLRKAGAIRNTWMVKYAQPDYAIAFPGGVGTSNMIRQCEAAGIPVKRIGDYYDDQDSIIERSNQGTVSVA